MKAILRKKKRDGEISLPRQHYKAIVIKTVWYWHKTDIDHWNSIESPEINAQTYIQLISNCGEKNRIFNRWCWENWKDTCKGTKIEHNLTPYTKVNSKWIKDLNVRPNTKTFFE